MRKTRASARLRAEDGFTLIEVLIATTILVSALLGSFLMLDVSAKVSRVDAAREGATNLAREINEDARSLPYSSITSASLVPSLQAMPGLANQSGGASWQIVRRGVTYTIAATETDVAAATKAAQEKQVTTAVSWTTTVTHTVAQTVTITSAGQQVVLTASQLQWANPPGSGWTGTVTQPTVNSTSVTSMTFSVQTPPNVSGVVWTLNGAVQTWSATVTATTSTAWTWTVSAPGWSLTGLPNATYSVGAAAANGNVTGQTITIPVKVITSPPGASSFVGAGFDPGLYSGGSIPSTTPAVLEWTGSDPNIIGYQIKNPSGTVICQTTLTDQKNALTYPASCGQNGANVWCQTPTQCIDFTAPSTSASNLTYSVAPLYYDSTNTLQVGTAATIALQGTSLAAYTLAPTTNNTTTNCPFTGAQDLSANYTGGGTDTQATSGSAAFCGPAFTSSQTIPGGASSAPYITTSSGNQSCSLSGTITGQGSAWYGSVTYFTWTSNTVTVPGGVTTPTNQYTLTWPNNGSVNMSTGERLDLQYSWSCGGHTTLTLHYGSSSYPSTLVFNFRAQLAAPNPPTGFSVTTNGDGSATLNWTAAGGSVPVTGYEIYRGGLNYNNRLYSDIASYFCSGTACSWTDNTRTSSPQTYYVTAVGNTTLGSNEGESTMVGPKSG